MIATRSPAQEVMDPKARDAKLLEAIRAAARKGIGPEKIEAAVGSEATINTVRERDRDTFSIADIAADPGRKPALPDRASLKWVAYWVRPVESRNPKIAGIFWPKKGKPQVFYGEVLPPE